MDVTPAGGPSPWSRVSVVEGGSGPGPRATPGVTPGAGLAGEAAPGSAEAPAVGQVEWGGSGGFWGESAGAEEYRRVGFLGRIGFGAHPAVVVVDLVRGYLDRSSPFWGPYEAVRASASRVVRAARQGGWPIVFTTLRYRPGLREAGFLSRKVPALRAFDDASPFGAFPAEPHPTRDDLSLSHAYWDVFAGTTLAATLRVAGVDTVVLVGLTTSGAVRASALGALAAGFRPIVVADAVGDRTPAVQIANLFDLDATLADVVSEGQAIGSLARLAAERAAGESGRGGEPGSASGAARTSPATAPPGAVPGSATPSGSPPVVGGSATTPSLGVEPGR